MSKIKSSIAQSVTTVAIEIYDAQANNRPHHFTSLVKIFEGKISRNIICMCLDILSDFELLEEEYAKIDENHSGKIIKISEVGIPLVRIWKENNRI